MGDSTPEYRHCNLPYPFGDQGHSELISRRQRGYDDMEDFRNVPHVGWRRLIVNLTSLFREGAMIGTVDDDDGRDERANPGDVVQRGLFQHSSRGKIGVSLNVGTVRAPSYTYCDEESRRE